METEGRRDNFTKSVKTNASEQQELKEKHESINPLWLNTTDTNIRRYFYLFRQKI
ncbi:hypothetical protein EXN66_Car000043 [Channa argus]|uniref:Uncharacterized protein n=1 Tax=Channa argus TaxID=215402 RepID=A0A6G1QW81_CHAAH|nr:hypothetical protein EXN66_Car000043 [Channa argus]